MKKMSFIKANGLLGILLGGILASSAALGQDPIEVSLSDESGPADGAIAVSFDFVGNGESSGFDADITFDDTNVVAVDLSSCLDGNDAFISNCAHPGGDTSIIRMTLAAAGADALGDFTGTIIFELDGTLTDGDVIALEWDPASLGANNPDADVTPTNGSITIGGPPGECVLSISPASHDFGIVTVGGTASQAFTISNDGDGDCTNVTAAVSGADFTLASDDCGTLAASATCTANVDFSPAAAGASAGTLDASADEGSTASADLSGTGDDGGGTGDDGGAVAIPTMQPLGLALLALVMLMIGAIGVRTFRS